MAEALSIDPKHLKSRHVNKAVEILRNGGVVIYPTDTVYGLGCDITNKDAIERVHRIKGRDKKKPMSFVCSDMADISLYAYVSKFSYRILKCFLPGAYTFVLPATKETPRILQTKQKTVGIRIPDHPLTLKLVAGLSNPIISTSANQSGHDVLSDPLELLETLGNQVDLVMECGTLPIQPSSVVSLVGDRIEVLRKGIGDLSFFEEHQ